MGGLVISTYQEGLLEYVRTDLPNVDLVAYVPSYRMSTVAMRKILPKELDYGEAVIASSIANVMVAGLMSGNIRTAGRMMEQDRFHEKYRSKLVAELEEVREIGWKHDVYATYLSGSGSTIMCISPPEKTEALMKELSAINEEGEVIKLALDQVGVERK
jgi:homoserine kinase